MRLSILVLLAPLLTACGSVAPIPQDTFYRLSVLSNEAPESSTPWTTGTVVVKRMRANGIYKDRALAVLKTDGVSLQQSKYHYWNDSPELMVQQRIFEHGVRNKIASQVSVEYTPDAAYFITGRLLRFERVEAGDTPPDVAVSLILGVQNATTNTIVYERKMSFREATQSADHHETVRQISAGLDRLIVDFLGEASVALAAQNAN